MKTSCCINKKHIYASGLCCMNSIINNRAGCTKAMTRFASTCISCGSLSATNTKYPATPAIMLRGSAHRFRNLSSFILYLQFLSLISNSFLPLHRHQAEYVGEKEIAKVRQKTHFAKYHLPTLLPNRYIPYKNEGCNH